MAQYKLVVVEGRFEIYSIGTFQDEKELEIWAQENDGELARAEPDAGEAK